MNKLKESSGVSFKLSRENGMLFVNFRFSDSVLSQMGDRVSCIKSVCLLKPTSDVTW